MSVWDSAPLRAQYLEPTQGSPLEKKEMTREEAIKVARDFAWAHRYSHDYIPTSYYEMQKWKPHEWVITAILEAANASK